MGKSSKPIIGYWYRVAYHHGLTIGPIDAFLEFRGGDKTAWQGELTASGTINITAPYLWGGEKDQGGIVGAVDVMFGESTQMPNSYLVSAFGVQTTAWRGFTTLAFKGGRYGAMNPYPQKPSYKFRQILNGWDDECWYPEKAEVTMVGGDAPINFDYDGGASFPNVVDVDVGAGTGIITLQYAAGPNPDKFEVWFDGVKVIDTGYHGRGAAIFSGSTTFQEALDSYLTSHSLPTESIVEIPGDDLDADVQWASVVNRESVSFVKATLTTSLTVKVYSPLSGTIWNASISRAGSEALIAANPAHVLYYSRTNSDMGREPTANINTASLAAAADRLYDEGFGICPKWDPASESVEDFEQRISKLIGGSFTRSLEDGQWYLDLARGDYVLDDLPILTDDDILEFKEQPSILDNAVNSVSVSYFDPETKETIVTPPVRALALVAAFGTIHQTNDYPEIPTGELAARIALRDLLTTATPTRAFDLVTTRKPYNWRPNRYFRLQSPKRGIADMVCIVGELQTGTLKSGAIKLKATQDIYSLPSTSFVQVEPGVDTRSSQTPSVVTLQRAFEAPYIDVVGAMSRTDFAALPSDVGYAMGVAATAGSDVDYTMMVDAGADYAEVAHGNWCATATIVGAADDPGDADFTLANGVRLDSVELGTGALWDDEIVRVDAIDADAGTITLGRGCADTVPAAHVDGSRLWFYDTGSARDATEYTDAESIDVKLLSNTGSQRLLLASATAISLTFASRLVRPYPPGKLQINATAYPTTVTGEFAVSWAHRNRDSQADQLVDTTMDSITPEANTRYHLQLLDDDGAVLVERSDIGPGTATVVLNYTGTVTLTLGTVDDVSTSWQRHRISFAYAPPGGTVVTAITATAYTPVDDSTIIDGGTI